MSARTKGNAAELRAQRELEAEGFLVHRAVQSGYRVGGRWLSRSNDVFGLFDLVAVAGAEEVYHVRFVQVTTAGNASVRRKKILAMRHRFPAGCVRLELWVWHPGRPTKRAKLRQNWTKEVL